MYFRGHQLKGAIWALKGEKGIKQFLPSLGAGGCITV